MLNFKLFVFGYCAVLISFILYHYSAISYLIQEGKIDEFFKPFLSTSSPTKKQVEFEVVQLAETKVEQVKKKPSLPKIYYNSGQNT